ncbi:hypothetical protein KJA17_00645 [Patescibacteria group bacterium]|nr:hypothetical protein [Patescibacteria group bacterium]
MAQPLPQEPEEPSPYVDFKISATGLYWQIFKAFFGSGDGPVGSRDPLRGYVGFAVEAAEVRLQGNTDIALVFEFGDLKNGEGDVIPTYLALVGGTPQSGNWKRAGRVVYGIPVESNLNVIQKKLWIQIRPHPSDSVCNYENKGKVIVKVLEQRPNIVP